MLTPTSSEASFILVGGDAINQGQPNNDSASESEGGEVTVKDDTAVCTRTYVARIRFKSFSLGRPPGSPSIN
jgi:hypothetical protein